MRTAVRAPKNRLEVVPPPQNGGAKPLIWPRFSPFQRLGHLTAHPCAHLLRRRRPQHIPACHFVQDHTEHASATPHPQPLQSQPILQAAVGRLDARASRVPLRKHRGLLFPPPPSQAMGLVGELQGVGAVSSLVDRARVAEGASPQTSGAISIPGNTRSAGSSSINRFTPPRRLSAKPSHPQVDPTTSFSTCRSPRLGCGNWSWAKEQSRYNFPVFLRYDNRHLALGSASRRAL